MPELSHVNEVDAYEMVYIPAGPAIFGSARSDRGAEAREKPQFTAELPGYYLGIYCVTNAQYAKFLTEAGASDSDLGKWISLVGACHVAKRGPEYAVDDEGKYGDHPVVLVSWYGAEAYCEWAGLRLPSELEWEKGARGDDGRRYPWGDEWEPDRCRCDEKRGEETTCGVWEYPDGMSPWGLGNTSGNVWEWCADWWEERAYRRYGRGRLEPPTFDRWTRPWKVLRGGSCFDPDPRSLRCAYRGEFALPSHHDCRFGFRCARDA